MMKKYITLISAITLLASLTIIAAPEQAGISKTVQAGETVAFTEEDFTNAAGTAGTLESIKLYGFPPETSGTLNLDGVPVTENQIIPKANLSKLTFSTFADSKGEVIIQWDALEGTDAFATAMNIAITIQSETTESPSPTQEPEISPSPSPEPQPSVYEDMIGHWGEYTAVKLYEQNMWKGESINGKNYFRPDENINRINFLLAILSAVRADIDEEIDPAVIFADEADLPYWVVKPAKWAYHKGIMKGVQVGDQVYIYPYNLLERAEAAQIIYNTTNIYVPKTREDLDFSDSETFPAWAAEAIRGLRGYGIIQGFEDNTFRPFSNVTRIQAGEMSYQLKKLIMQDSSLFKWAF